MVRFIKFLHRLYIRLWLKIHWRRLRDNAPEEYVHALEQDGKQ